MHGVVGAALFAVIDDVDTAFDLLAGDVLDGFAHRRIQLGLVPAVLLLLGEQEFDDLGGARQAAGVGGENAVDAAFHVVSSQCFASVFVLDQKAWTVSVTCSTSGGEAKQCPTSLRHSWKSAEPRKSTV